MTYSLFGRTLHKVGVVGSGQIGPDIALFFSKVLAPHGVPVVVNDVIAAALEAGAARTKKKIDKGVETGAFKAEEAQRMAQNITWTADKQALSGCDLVVEAATERLEIKHAIMEELEGILSADAIIASNSSHLEPEVIFAKAKRPERALVIHYFFPAERNLVVEVVPGKKTAPAVADFCMKFYEAIGKVPIRVRSRYGYAVDPIFEGLFQAALLCVEEGVGTTKQVDTVARKALGLGVGPFTAMNLTGGNPITQVGLTHYQTKIMKWFRSPKRLDERVAAKAAWEVPGREERVEVPPELERKIANRLLGAFFGLASEILNSGITNLGDLDMAVETALVIKPPFTLMNEIGVKKALKLVQDYAKANKGFKVAPVLVRQAKKGPWRIPVVFREDQGDVAVVVIKRPRVLNALNLEVYRQLFEEFTAIRKSKKLVGAVLTGFGTKAFVSGADIGMLAAVKGAKEGAATSKKSHEVQNFIEKLGKPVVCALNGLSLGGGSELAYACTARIARKGVRQLFGQPEVKLGIIPGAGGSVRLPRLIDFATAWKILRTGGSISGEEALKLGLILEEVEGDLTARACEVAREIAAGDLQIKPIAQGPIEVPATLPEVEPDGLSRKVDEILRRAILEGAKLPLAKGLANESKLFGEVCGTRDMRIGLENFLKTGLREPARFVHA
ncbi:MAG: enoyl-CoA hydratase/isomerase family protein [Planctomycetes bacterium]|nr:enoyl-CoA hydratase/isomerase family protein [Planctomycetota bacterium]